MSADAQGRELRDGDGARVLLDALIKSGGAGSVYRVQGAPLLVAKLYHPTVDLAQYERKVQAMLLLTPDLPELAEGNTRYVQIAWPRALLRDLRGRFVGYLMPAVDVSATSELECVMQEKQARSLGLPTGLGAKVTLAANLANVIAELHRQQHRVVDLKPVNLRFYPRSLYMAMLDCDGFSIQGKGERFDAPQVTVDYLAPEFQRGGLTAAGEEAQDRFALAVIVFQLLNFGIHPFTGRPANDRVPTDVPNRIAARLYAYGIKPNPQLAPNPVSGHAAMPVELRQLFDRAFDGSGVARPSPVEWGAALRPYAQRASLKLVACTQDGEHQHFAGLPCAACARNSLIANAARRRGQPPPAAEPARKGRMQRPGRGGKGTIPPPARKTPSYTPFNRPLPVPASVSSNNPGAGPSNSKIAGFVLMLFFLIVFALFNQEAKRQDGGYVPPPPLPSPYTRLRPTPPSEPPPKAVIPQDSYLGPIAWDDSFDDFAGPPSVGDIQFTDESMSAIAMAASGDNAPIIHEGMQQLLEAVPNLEARAAQRATDAKQFERFALDPASFTYPRDGMLRSYALLRKSPYDAEAACEWSWLAYVDSQQSYARAGFLRSIWADPQAACGWLGMSLYATTAGDDSDAYGLLLTAAKMQDPGQDPLVHERLAEAVFAAGSDNLKRWRIVDARAQVHAAQLRGAAPPAWAVRRAQEQLPSPPVPSPPR